MAPTTPPDGSLDDTLDGGAGERQAPGVHELPQLDEFRLIHLLGRGGMGEVYLGHDTVLDRAVAIKLIGERNADPASRARLLIEARAVARLSHPNVVAIFRVGTTVEGRPYLVQELIRGASLAELPRPVPWRRAVELGIGLARGLAAAHRSGILHRDVKPANVMVDDRGLARLLDFGLAKVLGPDAATLAVPLDGRRLIGTPRYAAPELWQGSDATPGSDLYSLGVVLYELVAGVAPYPQEDLDGLREAVVRGHARPLAELAPTVPPVLAQLVHRCLEVERQRRFSTADELVHELEQTLVDAPPLLDGNPYRGLRAFSAEHRAQFFGRGADISAMVDRLRSDSVVVVAGDSGIGKSSICHAGVLPAVRAGALEDHRRWNVVTLVPGRAPMSALREALGGAASLSGRDLVRAARPPADQGVLVIIDQFEEVVTLSQPDETAQLATAIAAVADGVPGVKVVLALRGDFLTRVAAIPELAGPLSRGLHVLRALSAAEVREAVVGPARSAGVRFESEAMVDSLVDAVRGDVGALPLLQFALAELWLARDVENKLLPAQALVRIGGVAGALTGHADAVLLSMGASEREAARRLLLRLVTAEGTRAVREADELVAGDPVAAAALESLVRGRLVVVRDAVVGAPGYSLAHEALLRGWATLRGWLDDAAGQRVAHDRLSRAAAEWHRLGRRADLVWSPRQLDEVRALEGLGATERAFVAAGQRAARRRVAVRALALAAAPLLALGVWGGVRAEAARVRDRAVAARLKASAEQRTLGTQHAAEAAQLRAEAFKRFDADEAEAGERRWSEARKAGARAREAFGNASAQLEGALLVDAPHGEVARQLASVVSALAELAEAERDRPALEALLARLAAYDDGTLLAAWRANAHLVLEVDPPTTYTVAEYQPVGERLELQPRVAEPTPTGHLELTLPAGSYLLTFGDGTRWPVVLARGEQRTQRLSLPRHGRTGFVYVPPGRFMVGSDQRDESFRKNFLKAQPLHAIESGAFFIARTEVTFADWLEFLRATPAAERERLRPRAGGSSGRLVRLEERRGGTFVLTLQPTTVQVKAAEGELVRLPGHQPAHWERLPVTGLSRADAVAYTLWLSSTGRVPGARLCTYREWERAARGADDRAYPHGLALEPAHANFDLTYGREATAFGPDEVGSFPASDSPFGVADLAGNVWELVEKVGTKPLSKGGSWHHGASSALIANRDVPEDTMRDIVLGFRVCAEVDATPAR